MNGLENCPFCGCEMTLQPIYTQPWKTQLYYPVPKGKYSLYACHKRGCQLENVSLATNAKTRKAAIEKWNRRADEQKTKHNIMREGEC